VPGPGFHPQLWKTKLDFQVHCRKSEKYEKVPRRNASHTGCNGVTPPLFDIFPAPVTK
jgi:hypothetical protein